MNTIVSLFLFVIGITIIVSTFQKQYYFKKFDEIFPKLTKINSKYKIIMLISLGITSILIGVIIQIGDYKIINPLYYIY